MAYYTDYDPTCVTVMRSFFRLLFNGPPPGSESMRVPGGWPRCLVRCAGRDLTADEWLADNFECDRSTTMLQEINNIRVSRVAHYKKNAKGCWSREFVVVTLLDGSRGDATPNEPLYLKYERSWEVKDDKKKRAEIETSTASAIATDQPAMRKDIITPWAPSDIDELNRSVNKSKELLLREMTFPSNPTILDLAAVLETHSTLSTEHRLYATMCYWYSGSTYEVLQNLYNGHDVDSEHARKATKLGITTGYRTIREKQDAQDIGSLVNLVKQQLNVDKKNPVPDEELEQVAKAELERIPKFDTLLQRSRERKGQVMAALEQRESERARIEIQGDQLETQGRELEAKNQELEAKDRELEAMARERAEGQAEMRRLRERLEVLQSAGSSGSSERALAVS